jgi:hypothetical protein
MTASWSVLLNSQTYADLGDISLYLSRPRAENRVYYELLAKNSMKLMKEDLDHWIESIIKLSLITAPCYRHVQSWHGWLFVVKNVV